MGFFRYWFRAVRVAYRDPAARPLVLTVVGLLATGTAVYAIFERWTVLDSLYFSVITLTTVGYGDFAPHTVVGKVFTMVYVLAGIAVILAFAETVLRHAMQLRAEAHPVVAPREPPRTGIHD